MRPVLFTVGAIPIPSFWAMVFLAFFVALLVIRRDMVERGFDARLAYDLVLWAYIGGWIGARLFVIPSGWKYFTEDPVAFLLSSSGWVWYGGVVGGAVGVLGWARAAGLPLAVVGDITAPALAIGLAIGRIGCQLAGDGDYGVPTDLPWGMSYPDGVVPTTDRVHPTPVYEMLLYAAIFVALWRQRGRGLPPGHLLGQYLLYSGAARFGVEFLRRNPGWIAGLTTAQCFSIASMAVGVWLIGRGRGSEGPRVRDESGPLNPRPLGPSTRS
jgi:phosphatidylglycerol---prolipoprotein diacylglyceryl transferase